MKQIALFIMMFVFAYGCAGQAAVKTVVVGPDGKQVSSGTEESGVILAMAPGASGAVYYVRIGGIQGPDNFTGTLGEGETQFVSLKQGMYALSVTAERNGVTGRAYQEFRLQPLQKLALNVQVYFPTGDSAGVSISFIPVTVPTVYIRYSASIHTVPINGRGTVVAIDLTHDWATPVGLTYLHVMTGGASHPFSMANCELQNANGVTISTVPTVTVEQDWDFSHTISHWSASIVFTGYDYQLPANLVTTLQVVCDITAGHNFVDFSVVGAGLDYNPFYYADFGSWANSILAE